MVIVVVVLVVVLVVIVHYSGVHTSRRLDNW